MIVRPVVAASSASSVFHWCGTRRPRRADQQPGKGCNVFPAFRHQVAMVFTANAAVSWSVHPPGVGTHVVHPVRVGLAEGVDEIVDLDCGSPDGRHSRPPFLYGPTAPSSWCRR